MLYATPSLRIVTQCLRASFHFRMCVCVCLHRFDRTLGGFELDVRLRDYLLQEFKKAKASQLQRDPADSPRAKAKLLKEAQKVKTVLSANTETFAQVWRSVANISSG